METFDYSGDVTKIELSDEEKAKLHESLTRTTIEFLTHLFTWNDYITLMTKKPIKNTPSYLDLRYSL